MDKKDQQLQNDSQPFIQEQTIKKNQFIKMKQNMQDIKVDEQQIKEQKSLNKEIQNKFTKQNLNESYIDQEKQIIKNNNHKDKVGEESKYFKESNDHMLQKEKNNDELIQKDKVEGINSNQNHFLNNQGVQGNVNQLQNNDLNIQIIQDGIIESDLQKIKDTLSNSKKINQQPTIKNHEANVQESKYSINDSKHHIYNDQLQIVQNCFQKCNKEQLQKLIEGLNNKKYTLKKFLGCGTEGNVFLAVQKSHQVIQNLPLDVKVPLTDFLKLPEFQIALKIQLINEQQFEEVKKEFDYLIKIQGNINIVYYLDQFFIEVEKGCNFCVIAIQYCESSLFDIIKKKQQLTEFEKLKICFHLINGLVELSLHNIVHLDIKPQNILKTFEGNYVYTDFGIFQISQKHKPKSVEVLGKTNKYASKEQISAYKGENAYVSFSSDVYSLGKLLQQIFDINSQSKLDQNILNLIQIKMLNEDQNKRIKIEQLPALLLDYTDNQEFLNEMEQQMKKLLKKIHDDTINLTYARVFAKEYYLALIKLNDKIKCCDKVKIELDKSDYLSKIGNFEYQEEEYDKAQNYFRKSLQLRIIYEKGNENLVALSYNDIGDTYLKLEQFEKALSSFNNSLQIQIQYLPEDLEFLINNISKKGSCYFEMGQVNKALNNFLEAYVLQKINQGNKEDEDEDEYEESIAELLNNIQICYEDLGEIDKAVKTALKLDKIQKYQDPRENLQNLSINQSQGEYFFQQGEYTKALDHFQKELENKNKLFFDNKNQIKFVNLFNDISQCYLKQNKPRRAIKYIEKALKIFKSIPDKDNSKEKAITLNNFGGIYLEMKNYEKALNLFEESIQIRRQLTGSQSLEVAKVLNNIAICHQFTFKLEKAEKLFEEALTIRQKFLPKNHMDISESLNNVGVIYFMQDKYESSLKKLEESLTIMRHIYKNENHPDIAKTIYNIGYCHYYLGKIEQSLLCFQQALKIAQQILVENHNDIILYLTKISECYEKLGQVQKKDIIQQKIKELKNSVNENIELIEEKEKVLKEAYDEYDYEQFENALKKFERYISIKKQIKDQDDYEYALCLSHAGICYKILKDYKNAIKVHQESNDILKKKKMINNDEIFVNLLSIYEIYGQLKEEKLRKSIEKEYQEYFKKSYVENRWLLEPKDLLQQFR